MVKVANIAYLFKPTATTYTELTGSGNVSAITNRRLMRSVIDYYQGALQTEELNNLFRQIRRIDYSAVVMDVLDPVVFAAITEDYIRRNADSTHQTPYVSGETDGAG
jgi:hypothetical protein